MYFITIGPALSKWYQKVFGQEVPTSLMVSKDKAESLLRLKQPDPIGLAEEQYRVLSTYFYAVTGCKEEDLAVSASLSTLLSLWCDAYELDSSAGQDARSAQVAPGANLQQWYRNVFGAALTQEWQIPVKFAVEMQETYEADTYLKYSTQAELHTLFCGLTGKRPTKKLEASRGLMQEALRSFRSAFTKDRDGLNRTESGARGPSILVPPVSATSSTIGLQQMQLSKS